MSDGKIVVIDDDPSISRILALAFERMGYHTITAMDGEAGLRTIREEKPNLVFIDVMMPGKDGYQVCQEIRHDPSIIQQPYIIMLTARGMVTERKKAEQSGADEFMTKPFSPTQLVERVRQIMGY